MARSVFCNSDVAYNWARQHVSHGRSHNGNFSFEGPLLYSYNTCIGNIIDGRYGKVWLLTSNHYSKTTTNRHISPVLRCFYHQQYYFRVPHVTIYGGIHSDNLSYLVAEYQSDLKAAMRSSYTIEQREGWRHDWLAQLADNAYRYAEAFDMPEPSFNVGEDIDSVIAHHAKRRAWRESPEGMKALEYGRKYRQWKNLIKKATYRLRVSSCGNCSDLDNIQSDLGIMSWWIARSGDPDDLAIIKWRFRREE